MGGHLASELAIKPVAMAGAWPDPFLNYSLLLKFQFDRRGLNVKKFESFFEAQNVNNVDGFDLPLRTFIFKSFFVE